MIDKNKRADDAEEAPAEGSKDVIVDEGWSNVDLHDGDGAPEADLPSDIEPQGDKI